MALNTDLRAMDHFTDTLQYGTPRKVRMRQCIKVLQQAPLAYLSIRVVQGLQPLSFYTIDAVLHTQPRLAMTLSLSSGGRIYNRWRNCADHEHQS